MNIDHRDGKQSELGYLVSNCIIRKAAYDAVKAGSEITLLTDTQVTGINTRQEQALVTLANGETITSQLVVAADSRYSEARRIMGISTAMHDFGKTMMVCAMEHEVPHQHIAWEWFDYGQTLALLPMNGKRSSVVITMSAQGIQQMMAMSEEDFNRDVETRFRHRLGKMKLMTTRHAYPLVTTYPQRFVAQRFALMGDAAVGMHPVTAHGFNFGLRGADTLAREIKAAHARNGDIAAASLLARYEQTHRRATRPLFLATHAIAKLYGNDSPPARLIRATTLRIGNRIAPFKRAVAGFLTEAH
jgi:ubiquinone biosynthesis UbiH/UbiF/VisC/COQ6 family hydroxylase